MKRLFFTVFLFLCFYQTAYAARKFTISGPSLGITVAEPSCDAVKAAYSWYKDIECIGFESAVSSAIKGGSAGFTVAGVITRTNEKDRFTAGISMSGGSCTAGAPAGNAEVPMYYNLNGVTVQTIRTATNVTGSVSGCAVRGIGYDGTGSCIGFPRGGATLMTCGVELQETGEDGGADSISDDDPGYNGSTTPETGGGTTPGGGDTGGGTTPGGGTGGGETGGGTTPGGSTGGGTGGGTTPGGSTGGGETGGGTTPGGGTGGGTGGGSGGSGSSCGAPGQPACKIDESGTPSGKGLWNDLLDLLARAGVQRQAGIDSAISSDGKDTSPGFFSLPTLPSNCVDPSVEIVGRNFSIPICEYLPMIGAGFEAFWFVAFALACMSMVSRAMSKPVS